ncbi:TPA: curlin [Escherichia coli]|uniref:curlin n=1 Tax=Enterobacteriaceae TaxID=543 RepID=UPI000E5C965E|nr:MULTISPECIES: curlin [Enterobacteriaceae]EFZ8639242.1 curlin [Shigella dysenteriae]EGD4756434.1 curlin [Shigella dysenteriae]RIE72785.1 curlin [Shigella dysenteriae]UDG22717.1 curlin [Escherichia coli]HCQ1307236.1 curlin [Escherichia coli]
MKLLKVAAIAAIVFSGSALAGVVPQYGGGGNGADVGQGSDDSSIDLTQRGFGNSATLDQWNGKNSEMTVKQFGGGNGAAVDQTASNSSVNVTQVGFGNNATAHQY